MRSLIRKLINLKCNLKLTGAVASENVWGLRQRFNEKPHAFKQTFDLLCPTLSNQCGVPLSADARSAAALVLS